MSDAMFQYNSGAPTVPYKLGYLTNSPCWADIVFIKNSGYWYDANGTLHPAGSLFSSSIANDMAQGPSLGLAHQ